MYYVYMLTNKSNRVLYIGVTNDLQRRLYEHHNEQIEGFTKRYHVHKLVHYEPFQDIRDAIAREKRLKGLLRSRKDEIMSQTNPLWEDLGLKLFPQLFQE